MELWLSAMIKSGCHTVGFCDHFVTINSYGAESEDLIEFLCCDLQRNPDAVARTSYDLIADGKEPILSLWHEGERLYLGRCRYDLAYILINEIIYQCIEDNRTGHAIHAAAIGFDKGAVLLPGKSGSGKSTFATWLVSQGCNYLTDELVILAGNEQRLHPFTRPFSIKTGSSSVISSFLQYDPKEVISGADGFMLPHRLVNPDFSTFSPSLSLILFPEYKEGATSELVKLSAAFGCAKLMECYVNARNIQGHGISQLAEYTRNTPIYQLTYGSFKGLYELLDEAFPTLFES